MSIEEQATIFYPASFEPRKGLPSLALIKEPRETGTTPENRNLKVLFDRAFGRNLAQIPIDEGTDLYGTGEVTGPLVRNGTVRKLWNTDNYAYGDDHGQRLYQAHPWVLGVRSDGSAFGILADTSSRLEIALGESIAFSTNGPPFRVIVIERKLPREVLQTLGKLTGTIPLPPLWSLGFHQSRCSYTPASRAKEVARTLRQKRLPSDGLWFDIDYMDGFRSFTFSKQAIPNPQALNAYLHKLHFKTVWIIDPGIKVDTEYPVYASGSARDVWIKTEEGRNYTGKLWPGDCVFPDFTRPETRRWWAGLCEHFMTVGADGMWNDMNEPTVFGEPGKTMPPGNLHAGGGELRPGSHARYHNVYGMLMAKASREGVQRAGPNKRPFVLTRSNFLGGQRYAATWTGDNSASWDHLKMSIPMLLNLGLSGQPFSGADIGGFAGDPSAELYGHWIALGALYPFSRVHSSRTTKDHEPWSFGPKIEEVARAALQRRYRLLPYLYTLFHEAHTRGLPIMRPLFFADPANRALRSEARAFLLGDDLWVIPKWAKGVPTPKGRWRTISLLEGDGPADPYQPELRLREGAIVPLIDAIQNTAEYTMDGLTLLISPNAEGSACGTLYDDAGEGLGYQRGQFSLTTYCAQKAGDAIVVREVEKKGQWPSRVASFKVRVVVDGRRFEGRGKLSESIVVRPLDPRPTRSSAKPGIPSKRR